MITFSKIEFLHSSKLELPKTIYKYRDWNDSNHKKIVTQREVFFASPESFEDEFDCKIPVRYDLLTFKDVCEGYKFHNPNMSRSACRESAKEWIKNGREIAMSKQKQIMVDSLKNYGVLSLTANPNNAVMWYKYANKHTGFCVGFDTKIMFQSFGGGGNVIYFDDLPKIHPIPKTSFEERHVLTIYSKLRKWEKEEEYRAFRFSTNPLSDEQRIERIPSEAYKEIILGKDMSCDLADDLLMSIPNELGHVEIKDEKLI